MPHHPLAAPGGPPTVMSAGAEGGDVDRDTVRTLIAAAMVVLGTVQVGFGVAGGDPGYAALGAVYALLGAGYYWGEVYRGAG